MRVERKSGPLDRWTILVIIVIAGLPASATTETLAYSGCYEVALVRPRPAASLASHMPPGFAVAPFPDSSGAMSAYISVGFRCTTGEEQVVEMLDLVPVIPPAGLAGSSGNYLLVRGSTSLTTSADRYTSWCVDIAAAAASFEEQTVDPVRTVTVRGRLHGEEAAIRSATATGADSVSAAGTLRVLSVDRGRVGLFDTVFTSASSGPPVGAVWSSGDWTEPAVAVHIAASPAAPNDWILSGRCA